MAKPGAAASLKPLDYLKHFEVAWRPHIESVSLVTEALTSEAITPDRAMKAVNALGRAYQTNRSWRLFDTFPVCTVVGFSSVAADGYQGGSLWPSIWERVPFFPDQTDQSIWGEGFLGALDALSLPRFDMPRRYVGNILMHSGIPTYCLNDFYRLLDMATRARGRSVDDVLAWLYPRLGTTSIPPIDKPVERFIEFGGDFAADLLDRCIDLLVRLRRDDSLDGLGLPDRFIEEARGHVQSHRVQAVRGGARAGTRPELRLDPWGGRVQVALPAVPDAVPTFTWQISDGDDVHVVRPVFDWSSGSFGAAAAVFDVTKQATHLQVSGSPGQAVTIDIDVVNPDSPVTYFEESGRRIPDGRPLPPSPVWVLRPNTAEFELKFTGSPHVLVSAAAPVGWATWTLECIDLADVTAISGAGLVTRAVRGLSRSHIELVGLRDDVSLRGMPVCASRPRVVMPTGHESMGSWTVSVLDTESGALLSTSSNVTADPFKDWKGPVLGDFEVVIRGPLGRGARKRVVVVEGLAVEVVPQIRALVAEGLQPVEGRLSAAPGIELEPSAFNLAGHEVSFPVAARCGEAVLSLSVAPRAMAVAIVEAGCPEAWSAGPARITTEAVAGAELLLRIPEFDLKLPIHLERSGERLQSLEPLGTSQTGQLRYALTRCADTAQAAGSGSFVIDMPDRVLPVAAFRPKVLATGATIAGDSLLLESFAGGDVECLAWSMTRPWLGPCIAPVEGDGRALLPEEWLEAPPLAVMVRTVDPWIPQAPLSLPDPDGVLFTDDFPRPDGLVVGVESPESAIATWRFWRHLRRRVGPLRRETLDVHVWPSIREHPDALEALAASELSQADKLRVLIESRAVELRAPVDVVQDGQALSLWRAEPVLAALLTGSALANKEAPDRLHETWEAFVTTVGTTGVGILSLARDPAAMDGRFGPSERALAHRPEDFEALLGMLTVVPRRFLDRDSRFVAALQLFRSLSSKRLGPTSKVAAAAVSHIRGAFEGAGLEHPVAAIDARVHPQDHDNWTALPAMSISMALAARYRARHLDGLQDALDQYSAYWVVLAKTAPKLVAIDLVLAELYAAGDFATSRPEFVEVAEEDGE